MFHMHRSLVCAVLVFAALVSASDDRRPKGFIVSMLSKAISKVPNLLVFPQNPIVLGMDILLFEIREKAERNLICQNRHENKTTVKALDGYDPTKPCHVYCQETLGGNAFTPMVKYFQVALSEGTETTRCFGDKHCRDGKCVDKKVVPPPAPLPLPLPQPLPLPLPLPLLLPLPLSLPLPFPLEMTAAPPPPPPTPAPPVPPTFGAEDEFETEPTVRRALKRKRPSVA